MKKVNLNSLLVASICCFTIAFGDEVYKGNGNTGFGGAIGQGSLSINDDGTTVTCTLTKGGGDFWDDFVMYIDWIPGGFGDTGSFTDTADRARSAISSSNGGIVTLNYKTPDFGADYAICLRGEGGTGSLFKLGTGSFSYVGGVNFAAVPGGAAGKASSKMTFSFTLASVGMTAGQPFRFITTYLNGADAWRSAESIGNDWVDTAFSGDHIGKSTANATAAGVYTTHAAPAAAQ